jgi:hypothetical protein
MRKGRVIVKRLSCEMANSKAGTALLVGFLWLDAEERVAAGGARGIDGLPAAFLGPHVHANLVELMPAHQRAKGGLLPPVLVTNLVKHEQADGGATPRPQQVKRACHTGHSHRPPRPRPRPCSRTVRALAAPAPSEAPAWTCPSCPCPSLAPPPSSPSADRPVEATASASRHPPQDCRLTRPAAAAAGSWPRPPGGHCPWPQGAPPPACPRPPTAAPRAEGGSSPADLGPLPTRRRNHHYHHDHHSSANAFQEAYTSLRGEFAIRWRCSTSAPVSWASATRDVVWWWCCIAGPHLEGMIWDGEHHRMTGNGDGDNAW